jgi:DNA topoisomerase-1
MPGITRQRRGRGFTYRNAHGRAIAAGPDRDRIVSLAIPPAWTDVWIAPHANNHIQALGTDAAGRRQYIYHSAWRDRMDEQKFERMLDLASVLPAARRAVTRDLALDGYTKERVLAGTFRLLDLGSVRPGADNYTDQHGSYGITTLRCSHATVHRDGTLELRFAGKSGKPWHLELSDAALSELVTGLKRRGRGARLFSWRDDGAMWHPVRPEDINAYVRERTQGPFSAKDFRTLAGSGVAALSLARSGEVQGEAAQRRAIAQAMRDAAAVLGNTAAIARASYVDPRIVGHFIAGRTVDPSGTRAIETELLALLSRP